MKTKKINGYDYVEKMELSGCDLTMFTCTYGGRYRVTFRFVKVK